MALNEITLSDVLITIPSLSVFSFKDDLPSANFNNSSIVFGKSVPALIDKSGATSN